MSAKRNKLKYIKNDDYLFQGNKKSRCRFIIFDFFVILVERSGGKITDHLHSLKGCRNTTAKSFS